MLNRFIVTARIDGKKGQCCVVASSKYNAKQRFYHKYPNAEIIKVEPLHTPDSFEQIVIEDDFEIGGGGLK